MAMSEMEVSIEEELSDEDFVEVLIEGLLPKVKEALEFQRMKAQKSAGGSENIEMPIGGNIEQQQTSGVKLVEDLRDKLVAMRCSKIDLATIDYSCLERVLNFLIRRGENYQEALIRLGQLKKVNERAN